VISGLSMVVFEPVSRMRTACFSFTSTVTRIALKRGLRSMGKTVWRWRLFGVGAGKGCLLAERDCLAKPIGTARISTAANGANSEKVSLRRFRPSLISAWSRLSIITGI
jgi:hypothetical protein